MTHAFPKATLLFTRVALCGLLAAAACALFNFTPRPALATQGAQPTPTPPRFYVAINHIKPDMVTDYEAYLKNDSLPAFKKAGGKQWSTWTTSNLGESSEYIIVRPIDGLKEFDEPDHLTKALGAAGRQAVITKFRRMLVSRHAFIVRAMPELSIPPKTNDAPKLAVVYRTKIAPDRAQEFEELFKTYTLPWISKAAQKAYLMSKVGFGGDSNEYFGMFLLDSFTDMGKWGSSFPAGGSGMGQKRFGIVLSSETAVYRYVPELSIR